MLHIPGVVRWLPQRELVLFVSVEALSCLVSLLEGLTSESVSYALYGSQYLSKSFIFIFTPTYIDFFNILDTINLYSLHSLQSPIDSWHSSLQNSICFRYITAVDCLLEFPLWRKEVLLHS